MVALSPGLAQGCAELLGVASRNALNVPQLREAFQQLGGLATNTVVETAQSLGWLHCNEQGVIVPTVSGVRLLSSPTYESMLRQMILDYIDCERPPWVQSAFYGRSRVLKFVGNQLLQVFVEADLATGTDDDVVSLWDAIAARARGLETDRLTSIGRQGERLTLAYEESRTGRKAKWTAVDNNADGYDVLSVVTKDDHRPLSIEVKASALGIAGTLYVTRGEWERAIEVENHLFHLWTVRSARPLLAAVAPQALGEHIPRDSGKGAWELVEVPFSAFSTEFRAVDLCPPARTAPHHSV